MAEDTDYREGSDSAIRFNGSLAYIDLLGFSDYVKQHTDGEIARKVGEYAHAVREATHRATWLSRSGKPLKVHHWYSIFSDSLVIYDPAWATSKSPGGAEQAQWHALERMILVCSHLSFKLLEMKQPFRGCITQGTYVVHEDEGNRGVIVAGKPVIEAYDWEGRQDWIGIMVCPCLETESYLKVRIPVEEGQLQRRSSNYFPYIVSRCPNLPVSCKRGCKNYVPRDHYAVVPSRRSDGTLDDAKESIKMARDALLQSRESAPPDVRHRYDVTRVWYDKLEADLKSAWRDFVTPH